MIDRWEEIRLWVIKRLRDDDVSLTKLAAQANVNFWWLNSLRLGNTVEPGWRKFGRVYEALGGRPPKCPAPLINDERPNIEVQAAPCSGVEPGTQA